MEQQQRILRMPEVKDRSGLSAATIDRRIKAGTFPTPVALGGRLRGWLESDIAQWIADRGKRATG